MNNRRKFFGTLAGLAAAAFLPWKRSKAPAWEGIVPNVKVSMIVPNPEYATAQYEMVFFNQPALFHAGIVDYPYRYRAVDEQGNGVGLIPPFKVVEHA